MTIREIRELTGLSQVNFAKACFNMSRRNVENWESGKTECPEYVTKALEYYFVHELDEICLYRPLGSTELFTEKQNTLDDQLIYYLPYGYSTIIPGLGIYNSDNMLCDFRCIDGKPIIIDGKKSLTLKYKALFKGEYSIQSGCYVYPDGTSKCIR